LDVQNCDGGWSFMSGINSSSDWHATIFALMCLLHLDQPSNVYSPMLEGASKREP
jgi:hypothetical protein